MNESATVVNSTVVNSTVVNSTVVNPQEVNAQDTATQPTVIASSDDSLAVVIAAVEAADDRKGAEIRVVKVTAVSYLADYFIVISGFSPVQVKAIARGIEEAVLEKCGRSVLRQEGLSEGRWVLQDYGDIVVHIFMPQEREYYNLEAFWGHGETIPLNRLLLPTFGVTLGAKNLTESSVTI